LEAKLKCPKCEKLTRVVSYGSGRGEPLTGTTACGHDVDAMFVEKSLAYEDGSTQEATAVHELHASRCPCGKCRSA